MRDTGGTEVVTEAMLADLLYVARILVSNAARTSVLAAVVLASCATPSAAPTGVLGFVGPTGTQFLVSDGPVTCIGTSINLSLKNNQFSEDDISLTCSDGSKPSASFYNANLAAGEGALDFSDGRNQPFRWTKQANVPAPVLRPINMVIM